MIRALALVACALTVCITAASAFIRHSQAGLSCDDWPRCYREATAGAPASAAQEGGAARAPAAGEAPRAPEAGETAAAPAAGGAAGASAAGVAAAAPDGSSPAVTAARGLHRLSAMLVGVLVLVIAVFGWSGMDGSARVAAAAALADTAFLAWLGRLTPHDLPLVTVGNLVGGLALAAAFAWIAARGGRRPGEPAVASAGAIAPAGAIASADAGAIARGVRLAWGALVLLGLLAWVGTMIGARHAIDACMGASCFESVRLDAAAFDPLRVQASVDAAAAHGLHLVHRALGIVFAIVVALLVLRSGALRGAGRSALLALLVAQLLLGMGTAAAGQPLLTATLHNALAAILAGVLAGVAALRAPAKLHGLGAR
ncbi:MAG: COX15/CtaA family protein [Burkholderiales bacterium]|nr:COX15/CtaA family protein [Burkholderiales bacterium]OJX00154.1 MAG: hypothetical protein BGO72_07155 [Burkholderiales bacterium 70-64]